MVSGSLNSKRPRNEIKSNLPSKLSFEILSPLKSPESFRNTRSIRRSPIDRGMGLKGRSVSQRPRQDVGCDSRGIYGGPGVIAPWREQISRERRAGRKYRLLFDKRVQRVFSGNERWSGPTGGMLNCPIDLLSANRLAGWLAAQAGIQINIS